MFTFEFSGQTFLVLISGSVVTILLHHSILLIWNQNTIWRTLSLSLQLTE